MCPAGRVLQATSTASAYSTGGTAASVSRSSGDANLDTTAVSTNGGDATAVLSADSGDHAQVTVANGDKVVTATAHKPSGWTDATACKAAPNKDNSQKDNNGRLWGYEGGMSCAYKDSKDTPIFYWEAAPACPDAPTADTATADSQGKFWGWANGASCAYRVGLAGELTAVVAGGAAAVCLLQRLVGCSIVCLLLLRKTLITTEHVLCCSCSPTQQGSCVQAVSCLLLPSPLLFPLVERLLQTPKQLVSRLLLAELALFVVIHSYTANLTPAEKAVMGARPQAYVARRELLAVVLPAQ